MTRAAETGGAASERLIVLAGQLFDGWQLVPGGAKTITVDGPTIVSVEPGIPAELPAGRILDYRQHTVLPGLIDAHVHLTMRGDGTPAQAATSLPSGELTAVAAGSAQAALRAGITTLRDTGSPGSSTFDLRRAGGGDLVLPRLLLTGAPVTMTGGHCWFMGGEADGVDGVRYRVRLLVREGADWIKVMATGGGTPGSYPARPSYTQPELDAIVDEAHRRNRKVTAHCLSGGGIAMAVAAGVDQIEHGGFATDAAGGSHFDRAVADGMHDAGVAVTPTLSVRMFILERAIEDADGSAASSLLIDGWRRRLENGMDQFRGLLSSGVRAVPGTDAGWHRSPFDALPTELALMIDCGMSTIDALRAATSGSAEHFGLQTTTGSIRPGLAADLLAVHGDPTRDIAALRAVHGVVAAGTVVRG